MSDSTQNLNAGTVRELKVREPDEPAMIDLSTETAEAIRGGATPTPKTTSTSSSKLFEIEDFSFDIEQTLNIGSQ